MPQIAKYKALGGSLGAYKKTLSDVQSKEYAKDFASYKDEQRRSMYGAIGGTVANIIGIAQEMKGIKKLKGYAESAKDFSGIEQRDGKFFSKSTGSELNQIALQHIGYRESLGIDTGYNPILQDPGRPDVPIEQIELGGKPESIGSDFKLDEMEPSQVVDLGGIPKYQREERSLNIPDSPLIDREKSIYEQKIDKVLDIGSDNIFSMIVGDSNENLFSDDNDELMRKTFGMESTMGTDPKAAGNPFQIKHSGMIDLAKEQGVDISNVEQASNFALSQMNENTRDFNAYKSLSGKVYDIYGILERHNVSKGLAKYLTWQQGRGGTLDLATGVESGKIEESTVKNMLNNLSDSQSFELRKKYMRPKDSYGFKNKNSARMFIKEWLNIQNTKWGRY